MMANFTRPEELFKYLDSLGDTSPRLKILVGCEYSGRVRDALTALGHIAVSCDLLPSDSPGLHYQGDILDIICYGWDGLIVFPDCTYLCVIGLHWNKVYASRARKTEEALVFVQTLLDAPIDIMGLENPVGCISSRIRKPDQIIQPYNFGEDASKRTCLWLKGLPLLKPTKYIPPRLVDGKPRWGNQTDSGQNRLGPSEDRAKIRSLTYQGVADAMAEQWFEDWSFLS